MIWRVEQFQSILIISVRESAEIRLNSTARKEVVLLWQPFHKYETGDNLEIYWRNKAPVTWDLVQGAQRAISAYVHRDRKGSNPFIHFILWQLFSCIIIHILKSPDFGWHFTFISQRSEGIRYGLRTRRSGFKSLKSVLYRLNKRIAASAIVFFIIHAQFIFSLSIQGDSGENIIILGSGSIGLCYKKFIGTCV